MKQSSERQHYHVGGTEGPCGTCTTVDEARLLVARQADQWTGRYGAEAVEARDGYTALWRHGVCIDFRTAYACTNPGCAPGARVPRSLTPTLRRAA